MAEVGEGLESFIPGELVPGWNLVHLGACPELVNVGFEEIGEEGSVVIIEGQRRWSECFDEVEQDRLHDVVVDSMLLEVGSAPHVDVIDDDVDAFAVVFAMPDDDGEVGAAG